MEDAAAEITALLYTYAERIDAGDFEGVAELFAHAQLSAEGRGVVASGYDAVLSTYVSTTRRYGDGTPMTQHLVSNPIVEVDREGGVARCRSRFTVLQAVPGVLGLQPVIAGRYEDEFQATADGWQFARRHMIVDLAGELSSHLTFGLDAPA